MQEKNHAKQMDLKKKNSCMSKMLKHSIHAEQKNSCTPNVGCQVPIFSLFFDQFLFFPIFTGKPPIFCYFLTVGAS